jgi:phosphohistidine phosphatase SixA
MKRTEPVKLFPRIAALLAAAVAAACATAPEAPAAPDVYVMRHLQKAGGTDPGLSEEGRGNAERLADRLAGAGIDAIYVSTTRRARETAAPLALRLKLTPVEYDPADTPGLVQRLLAERGSVLVVGHSNTVPEIVERLGGERPAALGEGDYGDVWIVRGEPRRTEKMSLGAP